MQNSSLAEIQDFSYIQVALLSGLIGLVRNMFVTADLKKVLQQHISICLWFQCKTESHEQNDYSH